MFDRSAILKSAWATAKRRKSVYAGTLREHFRVGLQMAWWDAKEAARCADDCARKAASQMAHFAGRSAASIRTEVHNMENTDWLGVAGIERLSDARRALAEAEAREAAETRAQRRANLLPVWDADAKASRSVNLATILSIKVDGATHTFNAAG